ncbi:hypothetical protein MAL08_18275 [Leptospira noguchii]|uniref:hypothetical protein n=1 Tax=Leptospira noguchii TaxID=28182 RepID=UPI001FB5A899|nr:hypothetical protein [Leptospira noguchii]UOG39876.1 hypothetical protein MAL08_18275 [Leptospira noguchii]
MGRSKKLSVSLLWSFEETQRLASMVARRNSASHSPWVVRQVLGQAVSLEYFKMFDYNVF